MRLSYLRNVDDPYGGRIISLSPSYTSNPYVLAASLADINRWPELEYPSSPPISDDEHDVDHKASGPSHLGTATGLRHHPTIMGNRSGALGMRVSGRRASTSRRVVDRLSFAQPDSESTHQPALSRVNPIGPADTDGPRPQEVEVISSLASRLSQKDDPLPPEPPAKEVQFIPKFKGAAEMEARRKLRMLARRGQASVIPKPVSDPNTYLNPEISSSDGDDDDDDGILEDDDNVDDFDDHVERPDDMDEGDEFDPYASPSSLIPSDI